MTADDGDEAPDSHNRRPLPGTTDGRDERWSQGCGGFAQLTVGARDEA